jgi:Kua-ubiquitin conjugating enzyme hybrid localisation domain.
MEFNKSSGCTEKEKNKDSKKLTTKIVQRLFIPFMILGSFVSIFTDLQFFTWIWYVSQVFLLWIAADFITGIIHWWEDTYGNPNWPIIGKHVVEPNLVHHKQPAKLLEGSYWNRINTSFFAAMIIGGVLWLFGWYSWQVVVCLLFCVQGNEIHAMSHRPDKVNGKAILFLQKTGILQSKKMHRWHHKAPYETNFCIMSDFTNPVLNKIGFWRKLEWLILKIFKIDVLRVSTIRNGL